MASTRLSDIANCASPGQAPRTIWFSKANTAAFNNMRMMSFPGHHSREQGGTVVADGEGRLSLQNVGGNGSTAGTFSPNLVLSDAAHFTVVGTFHTHPYDRTEGSVNGVSFSGADFAHLINNALMLSVVQSGPRLFALLRTAQTPASVDYNLLNSTQNTAIQARVASGRTFQQASRIEAEVAAPVYNLAYYQGLRGALTRVSPA